MAKQPKPTKLDCGCAHTDIFWSVMCTKHEAEFNARHAQAGLDYVRMMELASGKVQPSAETHTQSNNGKK